MSAQTPRFGFSYFGGSIAGSIAEDGQKFTYDDRLLLDRILAAIEAHDYRHRETPSEPIDEPTVIVLSDDGGTLEAGETLYYSISFVNHQGMETRVGPEVEASTPDPLSAPEMPSATALINGGALADGVYYYGLTALRDGEESTLSSPVTVTLLPGDGGVELGLPPLGEAEELRIWRMGINESGYTKIGTTTSDVFVDDGSVPPDPCACDPNNLPPMFNTGMARYSVTITLGPDDAAQIGTGNFRAWRIYRTPQSGNYGSESLVAEVTETVTEDPASGLTTTFVDDGSLLSSGRPSQTRQGLSMRPFTFETVTSLPPAADYPESYPLLKGKELYVKVGAKWELVAGAGGSGGGGGGGGAPAIMTDPMGQRWRMGVGPGGVLITTPTSQVGPPAPPQYGIQIEES